MDEILRSQMVVRLFMGSSGTGAPTDGRDPNERLDVPSSENKACEILDALGLFLWDGPKRLVASSLSKLPPSRNTIACRRKPARSQAG